MKVEKRYGFPVVDANNIFPFLEEKRIYKWSHTEPPMLLADYLKTDLDEGQQWEVDTFAPKTEVVRLQQPDGKVFNGFRAVGEDGVIVFTVFPGNLVLIEADFVHGGEVIRLKQPAGFYKTEDGLTIYQVAKNELKEEVGLLVDDEDLILLTPNGIHDEPRRLTMREYYFLADIHFPKLVEAKPNPTEFLQAVLIPFPEWLMLIQSGAVSDSTSITATMFALMYLGKTKR